MEYIPLPKDPALPPVQISLNNPQEHWYKATWEEHRNGTYWDGFPKRYGYEHDEYWSNDQQANKAWGNANFHRWIVSKPVQDLEDMTISWLFFGTLAEVTSCVLDPEEHLQPADDGVYMVKLTSTHMDRLLRRWHSIVTFFKGADYVRGSTQEDESVGYELDSEAFIAGRTNLPQPRGRPGQLAEVVEAELDAEGRSIPFERAFKCLQRSRAIAGLLCETIDTKVILVVATLHEFLATAMTELVFRGEVADTYAEKEGYHLGSWVEGADFTHYHRKVLRTLRWCPRTESELWKSSTRSLALDHFAINLKSLQTTEDHSNCSEDNCAAYQLDPEAYTIPHVVAKTSTCECAQLELDPDIASAILASDEDSYPIIRLSKTDVNDDVTIESFDGSEEDHYIAIFHVWSHGLGNPKRNALPRCQLQRIQSLVDDLASHANIGSDAVPFWMDTLCCPILPKESRRAAILKMAKTYERASCVLVIDRGLTMIDARELSNLEILMHVFRTTWMQRLWTLQEAKFAKKLWFQFHNGAVSAEHVLDQLLEGSQSITQILFRRQFLRPLTAKYTGLRERYRESNKVFNLPLSNACYRLMSLATSLSGRSTSWASDEAICIVNILGLDLAPILEMPTEDASCAGSRMREMWKQWPTVPLAIIFNHAPRLPYKGFRWAHSTFVRTQKWVVPLAEVEHDGVIDPEGRGLLVTPSSFVLRNNNMLTMIEHDIKLERETHSKWEKTAGTSELENYATCLILDLASGNWYDVRIHGPVHDPMPEFDTKDELAIVFTDDRSGTFVSSRTTPGLLVSMHDRDLDKGTIYVTSLYHVEIARQETPSEKLFSAGLQVKQILEENPALCGTVQDDKFVTGPAYDPSDPEVQLAMAKANWIAKMVLAEPDVASYVMTTMMKNNDPSTTAWRNATEEQRQDWDFRVDHGDVGIFYNQIVNVWLNLAFTPVVPVPRGLITYCVD
jgi:hypothetical protein